MRGSPKHMNSISGIDEDHQSNGFHNLKLELMQ